jgi:hypothetical protein
MLIEIAAMGILGNDDREIFHLQTADGLWF